MTRLFVATTVACLIAGGAAAQELSSGQSQLVSDRQSPTLDAQAGFAGTGYALTADSDTSAASIAFARQWDTPGGIDFSTTSIRLSAPLNKDTKVASFITDEGFVGATTIQVSFSTVRREEFALPGLLDERREIMARGRAACLNYALTDNEKKACREASWQTVLSILGETNRTPFEADITRLEDRAFATTPIWTSGITAALGYNAFKFRDPLNFAEAETDRTPYSLSAYLGYSPDAQPLYFAGGLEYKVDYKAATSRTLCPPVAVGSVAECFTGAFAAPEEDVNATVFALARRQFRTGFTGVFDVPVGFEAKAAYDFEDDVTGLSTSLYFVPDATGLLRGGVKASWSDEDDEFKLGIFVSSAFSLF